MEQTFQKRSQRLEPMIYGKIPPQATDIERAVLGACLLVRDAFTEVTELLTKDCFYLEANQRVFEAFTALHSTSRPIDVLTAKEQLRQSGDLESIGGEYYLTQLTDRVVSSANIKTHCRYILQAYIKREIIRVSGELIGEGYEDAGDAFELLDKAEQLILSVRNRTDQSTYKTLAGEMVQAFQHLEKIRHRNDHLTGITSGFLELDRVTCGWQDTDLIILAARPSVGKTAFAVNLAINASAAVPVGFFSLEMANRQLSNRILSSESGVFLWNLRNGKVDDTQMKTIYEKGMKPIGNRKIFLDDTPNMRLAEMKAKIRRMVKKDGVKIVFIDYLQLIRSGEKMQRKDLDIGYISSELKGIAKELEIPIICLSQLSRDVEKRSSEGEPKLSDLRDGGAIEQDADLVLFLWRPTEAEIEENIELVQYCNVKIEKHRNGTLERFLGKFIKEIQKWETVKVLDKAGMPAGSNWTPVKSWND